MIDDENGGTVSLAVAQSVVKSLFYSLAIYPVAVVILLFFIEVERLRYVTDDFIHLLPKATTNFSVSATPKLPVFQPYGSPGFPMLHRSRLLTFFLLMMK